MSFTGAFGLVLLAIVALALLGPSKLPRGLEGAWLMITNFRRSQAGLDPITLEQAQRIWRASDSPVYDLIQILYGGVEHLEELRRRIFIVLAALGIGAIAAGIFVNPILAVLIRPAQGVPMAVLRPTDMVWVYMEVIFGAAAVVALPVLLAQVLLFVRPALKTPQEKSVYRRIAIVGMPLAALFFVSGLVFAYLILLPFGLKALAAFGNDLAATNWNIREYFSFVLAVLLWLGVAFETPLVMTLLAGLGLVSPKTMMKQWRFAIVGVAFISAAITPTVDPVNMALVMLPLLGLYFLGVLMARSVYRPRSA